MLYALKRKNLEISKIESNEQFILKYPGGFFFSFEY